MKEATHLLMMEVAVGTIFNSRPTPLSSIHEPLGEKGPRDDCEEMNVENDEYMSSEEEIPQHLPGIVFDHSDSEL